MKASALRVATQRAINVSRRERDRGDQGGVRPLAPTAARVSGAALYAGLSEEVTAEVLGCSLGTVKSNLHHARRRRARALHERDFWPATMPKETV